jgi:hypothetical protein
MRPRLQRQRNATRHRHVEGGLVQGAQSEPVPTAMVATVIRGGMIGAHHRIEGVLHPPGVLPMRPLSVGFHILFF